MNVLAVMLRCICAVVGGAGCVFVRCMGFSYDHFMDCK